MTYAVMLCRVDKGLVGLYFCGSFSTKYTLHMKLVEDCSSPARARRAWIAYSTNFISLVFLII